MSSRLDSDEEIEIEFPQANIVAAKAIGGALASSIGPVSHDTLIVSALESRQDPPRGQRAIDEYTATSDGATILEELPVQHPIAPIIRRIVGPERPGDTDVVGESIPDGISSTAVLLAALLDEAETLLDRSLHPRSIARGYRLGAEQAALTLGSLSRPVSSFDDEQRARINVARSAMTGNDVGGQRETWAELAVESVDQVGMPNEETLAVRQLKSGAIADSRLVRGTVLDRNDIVDDRMPTHLTDANVLVLGGYKRGKASDGKTGGLQDPDVQRDGERIQIDAPDDIDQFDAVFADRRDRVVAGLVEADVDIVVTRLGISTEYKDLLVENDIVGIRGVNRLKLTQLARAVGATPVLDPTDVDPADLGYAGLVEQQLIERRRGRRKRRRIVVFDECDDPDSVTVLLRGVHGQMEEQATTEARKAAAATAVASGFSSHPAGVVPGGGATDLRVANAVRDAARAEDSRSQLALDAFADAAERLVFTLAKNAGMDPLTTVVDLRSAVERDEEDEFSGLVLPEGTVSDVLEAGVLDPTATRLRCYETAVEVANMILQVDDAIDATFSEEPTKPGDAIYPEHAEKHQDYLKERDDTIWNQ